MLHRLLASLCAIFVASAAHAAAWEQIGPFGGPMTIVATQGGGGRVYAVDQNNVFPTAYVSDDGGLRWSARSLPRGCMHPGDIVASTDGDVVMTCGMQFFRSADGMVSWTPYSPEGRNGFLSISPEGTRHAVFLSQVTLPYESVQRLYTTEDNGAHWIESQNPDVVPRSLAFDPSRPGRIVGLTPPNPPTNTYEYVHESTDYGRTWRYVSTVSLSMMCGPGDLFIDAAGTHYRSNCGVLRSTDGGVHWTAVGNPPEDLAAIRMIDPLRAGRLIAWTKGGLGLLQSVNGGDTWTGLPSPPGGLGDLDLRGGELWAATVRGVFAFDATQQTWLDRSDGIRAAAAPDIAATARGTLLTRDAVVRRSTDEGKTWLDVIVDGEPLVELFPHVTNPDIHLAFTATWRLVATLDGGLTWSERAPALSGVTSYSLPYRDLVATGPAGELVYASRWSFSDTGMAGCCYVSRDVVRSDDGGKTWHATRSPAGDALQFFVGTADPQTLFVSGNNGTYRSRNGGGQWERIGDSAFYDAAFVADPRDVSRWYAVWPGGRIHVSDDVGTTWRDISLPYATTASVELVVDGADTRKLWLVHDDAAVSSSEDGGAHWRLAVSPSPRLSLLPRTSRLRAGSPPTMYAGSEQGILRIALAEPLQPTPVRAVEFARIGGAIEHYFITADRGEMRGLDFSSVFMPFVRTGREFSVWPAGTVPPAGTSPTCRFYGLPEKGLDSHFFSASLAECDAVRARFAGSWVFETGDAFVAGLPDVAGACPGTMAPLYRVFNNRPDANHRYTTSRALRDEMVAKGWIAEGYGNDSVAMCVPVAAAALR